MIFSIFSNLIFFAIIFFLIEGLRWKCFPNMSDTQAILLTFTIVLFILFVSIGICNYHHDMETKRLRRKFEISLRDRPFIVPVEIDTSGYQNWDIGPYGKRHQTQTNNNPEDCHDKKSQSM